MLIYEILQRKLPILYIFYEWHDDARLQHSSRHWFRKKEAKILVQLMLTLEFAVRTFYDIFDWILRQVRTMGSEVYKLFTRHVSDQITSIHAYRMIEEYTNKCSEKKKNHRLKV